MSNLDFEVGEQVYDRVWHLVYVQQVEHRVWDRVEDRVWDRQQEVMKHV